MVPARLGIWLVAESEYSVQRGSVPNLHCTGGEVRNDDPIDCFSSGVCTRWRGVGIFSLARVSPLGHLTWSAKTRTQVGLVEVPSSDLAQAKSKKKVGQTEKVFESNIEPAAARCNFLF